MMQWKKKKILYVLLSLMLITVLATGCGKKNEAASERADDNKPVVLKVPSIVNPTRAIPFVVGEKLGYFAEEGISFEAVGVIPSAQTVAALVSGKIDVGAINGGHVNTMIAAVASDAKLKAVVGNTESTQEIPNMVFVTLEDSPIHSPQDLLGKKIGIGSIGGCNEYIPYIYLKRFGIDNAKGKLELVSIPEPNLEQALRQGNVDVIGLHNTKDFILSRGGLRYLFSDWEAFNGDTGGATPTFFTDKFIKEHPNVVKRFVRAYVKSLNWVNEHPEEAVDITVAKANSKRELARPVHFAPNGIIKEESVTSWIDILTNFGDIKPGLKPEQVYTNEFNPYYHK